MHYQADEVARCIREGSLESKLWGHEKSLFEMWVFDKASRFKCCLSLSNLTVNRFASKEDTSFLLVLRRLCKGSIRRRCVCHDKHGNGNVSSFYSVFSRPVLDCMIALMDDMLHPGPPIISSQMTSFDKSPYARDIVPFHYFKA